MAYLKLYKPYPPPTPISSQESFTDNDTDSVSRMKFSLPVTA